MFLAQLPACVVDEDASHHLRRDGEEMTAVLPVDLALAEQLDVCLVDDHGGLEAIVPPLPGELS